MNNPKKAAIIAATQKALETSDMLDGTRCVVEFKSVCCRVWRDKNTGAETADACASFNVKAFAGAKVADYSMTAAVFDPSKS